LMRSPSVKLRTDSRSVSAPVCAGEPTPSILPAGGSIYAYLIHFNISGRFGFFPYIRIPTR
jgi:hypothetical protein